MLLCHRRAAAIPHRWPDRPPTSLWSGEPHHVSNVCFWLRLRAIQVLDCRWFQYSGSTLALRFLAASHRRPPFVCLLLVPNFRYLAMLDAPGTLSMRRHSNVATLPVLMCGCAQVIEVMGSHPSLQVAPKCWTSGAWETMSDSSLPTGMVPTAEPQGRKLSLGVGTQFCFSCQSIRPRHIDDGVRAAGASSRRADRQVSLRILQGRGKVASGQ